LQLQCEGKRDGKSTSGSAAEPLISGKGTHNSGSGDLEHLVEEVGDHGRKKVEALRLRDQPRVSTRKKDRKDSVATLPDSAMRNVDSSFEK